MASAAIVRLNEVRDGVAELLKYARKGLLEDYRMNAAYLAVCEQRTFPRLISAAYCARWLAGMLACALVGHGTIEFEGHAGPNSAHESASCSRCGRCLMDHWYY